MMSVMDMLTTAEVAARLSVEPQTVRRWIAQGDLIAVRVGPRLWRISEHELKEFLDTTAIAR